MVVICTFSSSLHLTRLTCFQEVNISPNHLLPHCLHQHHPNVSDVDSTYPILLSVDQEKPLVSFHGDMWAVALIQVHFCSGRKITKVKEKRVVVYRKKKQMSKPKLPSLHQLNEMPTEKQHLSGSHLYAKVPIDTGIL